MQVQADFKFDRTKVIRGDSLREWKAGFMYTAAASNAYQQ